MKCCCTNDEQGPTKSTNFLAELDRIHREFKVPVAACESVAFQSAMVCGISTRYCGVIVVPNAQVFRPCCFHLQVLEAYDTAEPTPPEGEFFHGIHSVVGRLSTL